MPDLAVTHRLPGGGMNLWRIPLSELENGYGVPPLTTGGGTYSAGREGVARTYGVLIG
jgi:hypothetical protein